MADLRTLQPSFTGGELSPALGARVDLAKYSTGLKTALNLFVHPHGGVSNRAGLEFINRVKDSDRKARLIPFEFNTEQTYVLEFGHEVARVYRDGGLVLTGVGGPAYEFAIPYGEDDLADLVFAQEADVMYITHPGFAPRKLSRLADDNWSISTPTFAPTMTAPTGVSASALVGSGGTTYRYMVSAVSDATSEESLPSASASVTNDLNVAGNKNRVSWSAVAGAARYIVYKEDNGVYGYIGGTEGTQFDDENITADLSDTPQKGINPFTGADNYPRCVTFIDQRLAFASSNSNPQAAWLSQTANYENFGRSSPAKASDAITFRIRGRQVNEIRSMIAVRGLMVFTSGAEWIVTGSNGKYLDQTPVVDNQGYRGSARLQPIAVGNTVLFAQARGCVIRDFSYSITQDAFDGKDLTILASHLFGNRSIKAWAFAQAPYSIVWVILDDGSLVSLTYLKDHDVWGWTRQETAGVFEDVIVVAEGNEDVPYFVVRRSIGGVDYRHVERLHTRHFETIAEAFFVDSGLTYSGAPASTFHLPHLAGEGVVALADGNVVKRLTADEDGYVTLPFAASLVHIGLPYAAAFETLDLDIGLVRGGTVQGKLKTVSEATIRVEKTRGIWTGPTENNLVEYKQRSTEAWNEAISAYTGDITITPMWDWTKGGTTWVKQFDPLPMTILALMPDVSFT